MVRIISTLIVVSWLSGAQPPTQPPRTTPPAEQQPAPTPTPVQTPAPVMPTTGAPPATMPANVPTPSMDPDRKTALALLDRIEALVDGALQAKSDKSDKSVATSGKADIKPGSLESKSGKVVLDRATLDEILSEVAQVKMMLQR